MENLRKRIKIWILKTEKDIIKHMSKPSYISHKIFDKNLVVIHEKKMFNFKQTYICRVYCI